jgi:hypothetical protein
MLSYPSVTNGVHVSQGCALTHLALVVAIVTGLTRLVLEGLRAGGLIEVQRNFLNEVILAYHGSTDDDCDAAVDDLCVNVVDSFV